MFKLVISDDEGKTTAVPLVREEITIGRKEGNTIRLTDRNVSRRHAKLQKQSGTYLLQDLGSYNGTIINGTRVSDTRSIKHGDQIVIGDYKLAIVEESAAQVGTPSAAASTPPATAAMTAPDAPMMAPPSAGAGGHVGQPTIPAIPSALPVNPEAIVVPEDIQQLRLVFLAPAGTPGPVSISKLPMLLGRSEVADISLPFSSISREHARITLDNGQLVIEDLGSSNGVTVNGTKVNRQAIQKGDLCTMGVVEFRVALHGDATMVMAASSIGIPSNAPEAKKSNAGMMAGAGILAVLLIGGGSIFAYKNFSSSTQATPQNSNVITGSDPTPTAIPNPQTAQTAQSPTPGTGTATPANPTVANGNGGAEPTNVPPPNTDPVNVAANNNGTVPENPTPANSAGTPTVENNGAAQTDPGTQSGTQRPRTGRTQASAGSAGTARNGGSEPTPNQGARVVSSSTTGASNNTGSGSANNGSSTSSQATSTGASASGNSGSSSSGTAAAGGVNSSAQASACLLASDFNCVITALRNRAATENDFNMLVSAYRGLRNTAAMEQTMRRYLSRFPTGRYADRYRDTLGD